MKSTTSANIILIIAALMWSIGGLFIKLVDLSPIAITGTRSIAAALVFLVYLKRPQWHWNRYFIIGVFSYAAMMLLYVFLVLALYLPFGFTINHLLKFLWEIVVV